MARGRFDVYAHDGAFAREAARLIRVEYEQLPVVNDLETSMKNEVLIHEDWSRYDCSGACFPVQGTNIGDQYHLKKGDVDAIRFLAREGCFIQQDRVLSGMDRISGSIKEQAVSRST